MTSKYVNSLVLLYIWITRNRTSELNHKDVFIFIHEKISKITNMEVSYNQWEFYCCFCALNKMESKLLTLDCHLTHKVNSSTFIIGSVMQRI